MRWHDVRQRRVAANLQFLAVVIRHGLHTGTDDSFDNTENSRAEELPGHLGQKLLEAGITINGPHSWDPQILRPGALKRCARGSLEAGRAYADGDWECLALDEMAARLLRADKEASALATWRDWFSHLSFFNAQSLSRAKRSIERIYDGHADIYEAMLDPSQTYSCGYWANAETLEDAQTAKHELICRKLGIRDGTRVLDVGCGWGAFAAHAARVHGAEVTGVTLSRDQALKAVSRTRGLGVEIINDDYRRVTGTFDRVVSVGMFEHVGPRNYRTFFSKLRGWLTPDGLALLHCIGGDRSRLHIDAWMNTYVFPGAVLPSAAQVTAASEGLFLIEDWHNFGADYDRTLCAWHENLARAFRDQLVHEPERIRRTWRYYLLTGAGVFRARAAQLWQIVLSPHGVPGGYRRVC
jgi:cyclopropane-fatty-acyl-phospholipid synthase